MERLGPSDYEAMLAFLRRLYAIGRAETFPRHAIAGLARLIPSDVLTYNEIDPREQRATAVVEPAGSIPAWGVGTLARLTHQHPLVTHYARTRDSQPRKISDFLSLRQFRKLDLYNELFGPLSINYQMAVTIPSARGLVIGVAFNRSRRDFSERDRAVLEAIRPHLAQAYRNATERTILAERGEAAERGLNASGQHVVYLAPDGRVRPSAETAVALLARYCGTSIHDGDLLPSPLARWAREQRSVDRLGNALPATEITLHYGSRRLSVRLVSAGDGSRAGALVLREWAPPAESEGALTAREHDVLVLVAEGKTNPEIADQLSVSSRTVQKHLEHIYEKLGVTTRTAAAMKLNGR